jgi:hypothetical protein
MKVEELRKIVKDELVKIGYYEFPGLPPNASLTDAESVMIRETVRMRLGPPKWEGQLLEWAEGKFIYTDFRITSFEKIGDDWNIRATLKEWDRSTISHPEMAYFVKHPTINIKVVINDKTGEIRGLSTDAQR